MDLRSSDSPSVTGAYQIVGQTPPESGNASEGVGDNQNARDGIDVVENIPNPDNDEAPPSTADDNWNTS